jgi:KDZ transposase-like protein
VTPCTNFKAATDPKVSERYSDAGVILAACRHDIPLRLFNVRGTGERHSYAHLLLETIMNDAHCPKKLVMIVNALPKL